MEAISGLNVAIKTLTSSAIHKLRVFWMPSNNSSTIILISISLFMFAREVMG